MENVSLSVPPEDPADIYIPTIQAGGDPEEQQSPSPCSTTATAEQAVQLPTIRYTSSASAPPPLVAAANTRTAIVAAADAASAPAFFQYRTTTFTQVHFAAAQAFSYPPTPPLDGPCSASEQERAAHAEQQQQLAITQGPPPALEYPAENHHAAGAGSINPFPSLPTPPDVEAIHHHPHNAGPPPLASDAEGNSSPITTTSPHSLKPNSIMDVNAASAQWPAAQHASNICFAAPATGVSPQMFQFNPAARRTSPASLQPAIYYPAAAAVSMQQPNAVGQLQNGGPRPVPQLVKGLEGEYLFIFKVCVCVCGVIAC